MGNGTSAPRTSPQIQPGPSWSVSASISFTSHSYPLLLSYLQTCLLTFLLLHQDNLCAPFILWTPLPLTSPISLLFCLFSPSLVTLISSFLLILSSSVLPDLTNPYTRIQLFSHCVSGFLHLPTDVFLSYRVEVSLQQALFSSSLGACRSPFGL